MTRTTKPASGRPYQIYWGDTHHNVYVGPEDAALAMPMMEFCRYAATCLDFYAPAYYTAETQLHPALPAHNAEGRWQGVKTERWKSRQRIVREWAELEECTRAACAPGRFVTFPCYEWQGDGTWGDHNVVHRTEGHPVCRAQTAAELYRFLRRTGALAIPHHLAYLAGHRSKNWDVCDERVTPFAEIFSCHGCSETDEDCVPMRRNPHMGPSASGNTYACALDRGLHIGAICGTDSFGFVPGWYGRGLMACLADGLTRESLWDAFLARRVYGVTGDRIELRFTLNGSEMGAIVPATPARLIRVEVRGWDAIDRIEILRNNRVVATHCHQGRWEAPTAGRTTRFKVRIECGWGPFATELPLPDEKWRGQLVVHDGRVCGWQPCWIDFGQTPPSITGNGARFQLRSRHASGPYIADAYFNALVFEIEAAPDNRLSLELNGQRIEETLAGLCRASRILWYEEETRRHLARLTGLRPEHCERPDTFYHCGRKAKIHRAVPESGYTAGIEWEDDEPLAGPTHYRVRVEQRNGQRAWSSPIWVE